MQNLFVGSIRRFTIPNLLVNLTLISALLSAWVTPLNAETAPLRLGIMPFNSTLALIKTHHPLRKYLQGELGQSINIYTSADYIAFQKDSTAGEFDLLITGPHFGVICLEAGYIPLVRYDTTLQPVFVLRKNSKIHDVVDFKGKRIGLPNELSVSAIGGLGWLRERGLIAGKDFTVVEKPTHGAAVAAVTVGDLDAALTTYTPLKQIPADVRELIRVMPTDVHMPHLMTLAHERLGRKNIQHLKDALASFPDTTEGREFFKKTGYSGYLPIDEESIEKLRPFIPIVKELMQRD